MVPGVPRHPRCISARILLAACWMSFVILSAGYSGSLVAVFTMQKQAIPFDTLHGLANQKEYKAGLVDGQALTIVLKVR